MREFKFRAWHKKDKIMLDFLKIGDDLNSSFKSENLVYMQYTGLKDKNGVDIYEGDLINLFYTSKQEDWVFDGVYRVSITPTGVKLKFIKLLWECGGYNQVPYENADVSEFGFVRNDYKNTTSEHRLCVSESDKWNYSNYFEVIGNVHENPELLEWQ